MELAGGEYIERGGSWEFEIYRSHREEFDRYLRQLSLVPATIVSIDEVEIEYRRYLDYFASAQSRPLADPAAAGAGEKVALQIRRLGSALDSLDGRIRTALENSYRLVQGDSKNALLVILLLGAAGLVAGLLPALMVATRLRSSLSELGRATQMIADGVFHYDPQVRGEDEAADLARGLRSMGQKLKSYEQMCLDASPLTRLPGNIAIERALFDRIRRGEKYALCYADLDDFKAFNDTYGYVKGSEIIKVTGEIIHEAKRRFGDSEDFVGHIGGDDFVVITSPENVKDVCQNIIDEFDRVIPFFYRQEDRERGYIEAVDRYGTARRFPIMTISIAVVSDAARELLSPTEIAKVAAEIKEFVKKLPGSNYLLDRRRRARQQGQSQEAAASRES